jgi:diadenylate cyclase
LEFLQFKFVDFVDVVIVAFIIYQFLRFIKGTRATQMLIGLGLLFVLALVANFWELYGLKWIVGSFKTIWIVAFVILFQPEIRRALAELGRSRAVRFFFRVTPVRPIKEIVRAAELLKNRNIGGLVVLEREMGLKNYVQTGTKIDALVSADLIATIFTPNSPLHDGAIIIAEDTIVAAACILPLSDSPVLDRALGTRHRAALGLSEETDAACVVVSEETGTLSLAHKGRLIRGLDAHTLEKRLSNVMA